MFGSVDEANAVGQVREKGCPRLHRGQMTAFAFDAQVFLDVTLHSHQKHQGLRLMSVELIGDEDPGRLWVRLNGLGDVSSEVGFGAGGSKAGHDHSPRGHLQIGNQAQSTMPLVFEFLSLDVTRQHRQRWVESFEGLDARHFIGAHHMRTRRGERWSRFIDLTDRADLRGEIGRIVSGWGEPIPLAMGL